MSHEAEAAGNPDIVLLFDSTIYYLNGNQLSRHYCFINLSVSPGWHVSACALWLVVSCWIIAHCAWLCAGRAGAEGQGGCAWVQVCTHAESEDKASAAVCMSVRV